MSRATVKIMIAVLCGVIAAPAAGAVPPDESSDIAHLPESIQAEIEAWRDQIREAKCLKVVSETEQTWVNLYQLDSDGEPVIVRRERFQVHTWMTSGMVWMVIFAYNGEAVDTDTPYYQMLWRKESAMVWERSWSPNTEKYLVRRYPWKGEFGPDDGNVNSKGCIYATGLHSWLAGGPELEDRTDMIESIAFMRSPYLAIVPPDPSRRGIWFDVFRDSHERDSGVFESGVYRRHDFMLLSRNETGQPQLREWRTIVVTDPEDGGRKPQEITASERFTYNFYDSPPKELLRSTDNFAHDMDQIVIGT